MANKNFRKYFNKENKLNPGYGYSRGIQSREWWSNIVKTVIKDDLEAKHKPNLFDSTKLNNLSNIIYDEFKKAKYWEKYSDCEMVLDKCKQIYGLKLGIISNFDERLIEILKNLNLLSYFDFICIPSNCDGFAKPNEKIFMNAFKKSGCQYPEQILHVGDNLELDYFPSKTQNFQSILLKHSSDEKKIKDFLKNMPSCIHNQGNYAFNLQDFFFKIKNLVSL